MGGRKNNPLSAIQPPGITCPFVGFDFGQPLRALQREAVFTHLATSYVEPRVPSESEP